MDIMCTDNRFEIIGKAKKHLLEATNIDTSEDEMKVLDNFLFRCWQMGWLDRYDEQTEPKRGEWIAKTENCHSHWVCSECGAWALLEYNEQMCLSNFCPNCGADMREREGE